MLVLFLAIELLDELLGSARAAAWPLIRDDLDLTYAEIGLVLAVPGIVGSALEPLVGVAADTARRRALLLAGGIVFALSATLTAVATGFWPLLLALVIGNPATSAFVSLAQASLMDAEPERRERNMAWWTLAGSVGVVAGPLALAAAIAGGVGWRGLLLVLAGAALGLVWLARALPFDGSRAQSRLRAGLANAVLALRRLDVVRWLAVLRLSDFMLDVLYGFLALYLVDVVGVDAAHAALAVAVWTGAGLAGDLLLLPLLARVDGLRYLRASALAVAAAYPLFLAVPGLGAKLALLALLGLLNSGWYAIPKARLYAALPGQSGAAIAVGSVGGVAGALVTLGLGFVADQAGLPVTMWLLLAGPLGLLVLLSRR